MDIFLTYWGSPWIAHPIVSFQFGDNDYIAMSIETRKEVGEVYSAVRGFFRYYELIYTVSDERDVVRLRTNYRKGEETYLFHTLATPEHARATFPELSEKDKPDTKSSGVVQRADQQLHHQHRRAGGGAAVGLARPAERPRRPDALRTGDLATGTLPFAQLKEQAHINAAARAAGDAPDFSRRIREGRAGF